MQPFAPPAVPADRLKCVIAMDEIKYKGWRIDVLHQGDGWKALIYRPSSPLHEINVPNGSDRRAVLEEATMIIDGLLETGTESRVTANAATPMGERHADSC
jgi:hypothetical protein